MRDMIKKVKRCVAVCLCVALFLTTDQITSAHENADSDIMQEYLEKVAAGVEVYLLVDEEGVMFGYYEPYGKENVNAVMPRYGVNINWTIAPQKSSYGENVYTLGEGIEISVSIAVSQEGTSYLGLYDTAADKVRKFADTKSTNGWNGKLILTSEFTTSTYSFAILNYSDSTITYTGHYSL